MADEQQNTSETGVEGAGAATDTRDEQGAGQQDLGEGGKKALSEERKARAAAERQAKSAQKQLDELTAKLQEYEDAKKSDLDKLSERATTAEQRAEQAQAELLRYRVARDKKIPAEWVDRLRGSTQEDLEADADSLLEALGEQQRRQTPSYDGGVRQTAKPTDMNSLIRQQAGMG
ncbi:hypothetical protein [Streptomyces smyrnaeus]|uniref:hypothetical protein n=1 Tax=Streptomyces smyrnaeus TaxID=1387713 RepID=UPI0033C7CCB2